MKSPIKLIKANLDINAGFTLIELLVATIIMSIVVTTALTGFIAILQQNQKAEMETQRRTNLNRALDYIANDIRRANRIEAGRATGEIMKLSIAEVQLVGRANKFNYDASFVSYATQAIDQTKIWEGPTTITRKTATTSSLLASATTNLLVDGIKAPSTSPTCPTDSTLNGSDGFYACIYSGGTKVDLYLYGKLSDNSNETMEVKSTVYTRSQQLN
ncbi:MAG: prepilin-type N-terminal cleavage/methylation domain-containing protein [Sphaerospermopsis sp. SIO1G2]|nr:prepilin-type N-terminal cleavage/methylation domain-containing protein [Sphaerospermopsis sp. SIO1G2]